MLSKLFLNRKGSDFQSVIQNILTLLDNQDVKKIKQIFFNIKLYKNSNLKSYNLNLKLLNKILKKNNLEFYYQDVAELELSDMDIDVVFNNCSIVDIDDELEAEDNNEIFIKLNKKNIEGRFNDNITKAGLKDSELLDHVGHLDFNNIFEFNNNNEQLYKIQNPGLDDLDSIINNDNFDIEDLGINANLQLEEEKPSILPNYDDKESTINIELKNVNINIQNDKQTIILNTFLENENISISSSNWVYLGGLPYDFIEEEVEQEIRNKCLQFGGIKDIIMFKYIDYVSFEEKKNTKNIPQDLEKYFNVFDRKNDTKTLNYDHSSYYPNEYVSLSSGLPINNEQSATLPNSNIECNKVTIKEGVELLKKSNILIKNFKSSKIKKMNKSYCFINFKDESAKNDCLNDDLRVFGMEISGNLCIFDNADYKRSLKIYNIPFGIQLKELIDTINSLLSEEGIKIECNENLIITKNYILLKCESLYQSLLIYDILNDQEVLNRKIKVNHLFGNLKKNYSNYSEIFESKSFNNIKNKMETLRFQKYSNILDNNIYEKFINLDIMDDGDTIDKEYDEEYNYDGTDNLCISEYEHIDDDVIDAFKLHN